MTRHSGGWVDPRHDLHAAACRRMWAAVLVAVLNDANVEYCRALRKRRDGSDVIAAARRYLNSRSGRMIAACCGVELNVESTLRTIALPRAEFRARLCIDARSAGGDDA